MEEAAIDVFGYGLAAGLSPVALIVTVVLLTSGSGRSNGLLFMAGFVLTIAVICTVTLLIADRVAPEQGSQIAETLLELGIGLILLVAAWTERPGRDPAEGGGSRAKRLFAKLDDVSAPAAFGIGALLVVSPKRLGITVLAGLMIASARLTVAEDLVLDGLYVITASALVWLTVLVAIVGARRVEPILVSTKTWLLENAQAVAFVASLAFGVLFTGSAILDLIL
jgi:hypothetical protein